MKVAAYLFLFGFSMKFCLLNYIHVHGIDVSRSRPEDILDSSNKVERNCK